MPLANTGRVEDLEPSVFNVGAEVSNLGGAFCELYSALILFPRRERNKNTISHCNATVCVKRSSTGNIS
jgi:hypothetical protein